MRKWRRFHTISLSRLSSHYLPPRSSPLTQLRSVRGLPRLQVIPHSHQDGYRALQVLMTPAWRCTHSNSYSCLGLRVDILSGEAALSRSIYDSSPAKLHQRTPVRKRLLAPHHGQWPGRPHEDTVQHRTCHAPGVVLVYRRRHRVKAMCGRPPVADDKVENSWVPEEELARNIVRRCKYKASRRVRLPRVSLVCS